MESHAGVVAARQPAAADPPIAALRAALLRFLEARTASSGLLYETPLTEFHRSPDAKLFRFRLADPRPAGLEGDLVLRIPRSEKLAKRQALIQQTIADLGFPTPRVLLWGDADAGLGRAFLIMELASGGGAGQDGRRAPVPLLLSEAMARLHDIDADRVGETLLRSGLSLDALSLTATLDELEEGIAPLRSRGFGDAVAWLRRNQPKMEEAVVCHGDLHALNLHVLDGRIVAVLDWSSAVFADPCWDLVSTCLPLAQIPLRGHRWAARCRAEYAARRPSVRIHSLGWFETLYALRILATVAGWRLRRDEMVFPHHEYYARGYADCVRKRTGMSIRMPPSRGLATKLVSRLSRIRL